MKAKSLEEIMLRRRSIRKYDEAVDIPSEEMIKMIELATTAPSSSNMQPWRFVVVDRTEAKERILPHAQFNVTPVKTAAAVIAIYGDLQSVENAEYIMQRTDDIRKQAIGGEDTSPRLPEGKSPSEAVMGFYAAMARAQKQNIALIDCGLVTMQLMQAAKLFGYDTCALGAYDKDAVAKALGMDTERYASVMLLTVGKALEEGNPQYRLPVSKVTKFVR